MHRKLIWVVCLVALVLAFIGPAYAAPALPVWHGVRPGETLFSIGRLYNVSPWAIARANYLADPNKIYAGQRLYIPDGPAYPGKPCGQYYHVQIGDTLHGIGRRYGANPWVIAAANGIYNLNYIYVGQVLYIPCHP